MFLVFGCSLIFRIHAWDQCAPPLKCISQSSALTNDEFGFSAQMQNIVFRNSRMTFRCLCRQCNQFASLSCFEDFALYISCFSCLCSTTHALQHTCVQQPIPYNRPWEISNNGTFLCAGNTPDLLLVRWKDLVAIETPSLLNDRTCRLAPPQVLEKHCAIA